MSISVSCELCGKEIKVKDEFAGKKVKCPGCGGVLAIPRAASDDEESFDDFEDVPEESAPRRVKAIGGAKKKGRKGGRSQSSLIIRTAVLTSLLGVLGIVLFLMAWGRFGAPAPSVAQQPNPTAGPQSAPAAALPVVPVEQLRWLPFTMNRGLMVIDLPGVPDVENVDQSWSALPLEEFRIHKAEANGGMVHVVTGFGAKNVRDYEEHKQIFDQFEQQFLQTHPGTTIQIQDDQLVQGMAARKTSFAAGGRIVGWQQMVWTGSQFILIRLAQTGNADFSAVQQRVFNSIQFKPASSSPVPNAIVPSVAAVPRPGADPAPPIVRDPQAIPWAICQDESRLFEVQGPGTPGRIVRELGRTIEKFIWRMGNPNSPTYLTFGVMRWNAGEIRDRTALLAFARKHSDDFRASYVKLVKPARFERTETTWQGYPAFETYTNNEKGLQVHEFLVYTMDCQVKLELVWGEGDEPRDLWERFTGSLKALK